MKNTFVKLFLALAMCFMIGSALVACGGDVDLGVNAEGYITINGEATDVKVSNNGAACKEHKIEKLEVKAHTKDADGIVLEVCTECNDYAKVSAGTVHNFVEKTEAASCTEEGFKGEVCSICGEHGEGEALAAVGHKLSDDVIINVGATDACTLGGVAVKNCTVCGHMEGPVTVEAVGHVVDEWTLADGEVAPTELAGAIYNGTCIYCNEKQNISVPSLNDKDYKTSWKNGKVPTCYIEGVKVYEYIVKNEKNTDNVWDKNLKVVADGASKKADHILAGRSYNEFKNADGNYEFYADKDGDGKVEAVGFEEYAAGKITCNGTSKAYFKCEACDFVVDVPNVHKAHFGAETISVAAACHTPGTKSVACVNCENTITESYTVPHKYEYTIEQVTVAPTSEGSEPTVTFNLVAKCYADKSYKDADGKTQTVKCYAQSVENCFANADADKATKAYEAAVNAGLVGSEVTKNVNAIDTKEGADATCYAYGYDIYRHVMAETKTVVDAKVYHDLNKDGIIGPVDTDKDGKLSEEEKLVNPDLISHSLNGVLESEIVKKEGYLLTTMAGIMPVSNVSFKQCGTVYSIVYECSACVAYKAASGEEIGTLVPSVAQMPHSKSVYVVSEGENPTKDATCSATGTEWWKCLNEGCTFANGKADVLPKLGHEYTFTYSVAADAKDIDNDKNIKELVLSVTGQCNRDCKDCDTKIEKAVYIADTFAGADLNRKEGKAATCVNSKIDKYSYYVGVDVVVTPVAEGAAEGTEPDVAVTLTVETKDKDGKFREGLEGVFAVNYEVVDVAKAPHDYEDYTAEELKAVQKVVDYEVVDEEGNVTKYVAILTPCTECGEFKQLDASILAEIYYADAE